MVKTTIIALMLLVAAQAEAASLHICYKVAAIDLPDVASVRLYVGPVQAAFWPAPTVADTATCQDISLPTTVQRGLTLPYTLKSVNAFGEEGTASNAVTFRAPNVPGAPTAVSVGATLP